MSQVQSGEVRILGMDAPDIAKFVESDLYEKALPLISGHPKFSAYMDAKPLGQEYETLVKQKARAHSLTTAGVASLIFGFILGVILIIVAGFLGKNIVLAMIGVGVIMLGIVLMVVFFSLCPEIKRTDTNVIHDLEHSNIALMQQLERYLKLPTSTLANMPFEELKSLAHEILVLHAMTVLATQQALEEEVLTKTKDALQIHDAAALVLYTKKVMSDKFDGLKSFGLTAENWDPYFREAKPKLAQSSTKEKQ